METGIKLLKFSIVDQVPHQIERDADPHQSNKLDRDPHESDKLDPDRHQFAEEKPKCMKYEPSWAFFQGF